MMLLASGDCSAPKAHSHGSLGHRPRNSIVRCKPSAESAIQRGDTFSVPNIPLVEIKPLPAQEFAVFLLKGASGMMLLLAYSTEGTPLLLPKGEDEGEGLFCCRCSSANEIARKTSGWRTNKYLLSAKGAVSCKPGASPQDSNCPTNYALKARVSAATISCS